MSSNNDKGFSLIELMVAITLIGIISTIFFTMFNTSISQYFSLQRESTNFTDLASQSQRISNVLRSITEIETANPNELVAYAYFSPDDQYVSKVRYYKNPASTKLFVETTNMTANPPIGTVIESSKKNYEIIEKFFPGSAKDLFEYQSASGDELSAPVSDLNAIKAIRVNLAVPSGNDAIDQAMSVQVSLRNRKTNL